MDLNEYLWRTKTKMKDLAERTGYCTASLHLMKKGQGSPSLINAFRIYYATNGHIKLEEMVKKEDLKEIKELKARFSIHEHEHPL